MYHPRRKGVTKLSQEATNDQTNKISMLFISPLSTFSFFLSKNFWAIFRWGGEQRES